MGQSVPVGHTWYFQVRAVGQGGRTSEFSPRISLVSAAPPNRPKLIRVISKHPWEVVMFWETPDWSGSPVTGYEVSNDGFQNSIIALDHTATQYMFIDMNWKDAPLVLSQDMNESTADSNASNGTNDSNQSGVEGAQIESLSSLSSTVAVTSTSDPILYSVRALNAAGRG